MKRLLTYLFLVIGLGLIFSGSTFAKEKVYFCKRPGDYWKGVSRISTIPCSKIVMTLANKHKKWETISAKKYVTYTIDAYGSEDTVIQSLYDDFEKHNLDTNIIREIIKKEKKKSKTVIAKEKEEREKFLKKGKDLAGLKMYDAGGHAGIIAMCLNEKNLNKVRLSYFNDLETYKKFGSFKKGECNYVVSRKLNQHLYQQLWKKALAKEKYEIEKKFIDDYVDWTKEIFYVSPKGEMIEVVALVFFEPNQTNKDGTPKVYNERWRDPKSLEESVTVTVRSKIDKNIFINRTKPTKKEATQSALEGCTLQYKLRGDLLTNKKKQKKLMDACYVSSEKFNKKEKEKELTGKPLSTKKLASFLLDNVITINYDGKEESYIFSKKDLGPICNGARCWKHIYEVREGPKMVGKGTWVYSKMSQFSPGEDDTDTYQNERDLSKFANLNKKLSKNSIKMSGSRNMYLQVYKKLDGVSTYAWVPGVYEDPKKNKKDDKINRAIVDITPTKDFDKRIETIELVKLASSEGTQIAKQIEEEKEKDEEGKKQELLLAQKQAEEAKKKELLLAQKQAEEETKKQALTKLAKFTPKIGYPDKWRDYSKLKIDPNDLVGNFRRASQFYYQRGIDKLGKPIDKTEWHMNPQTVNAYYSPVMNEIVFPAAILQPPFFNLKADDAVNYGGIGGVIGHEMGHGFDDQGSKSDGDGVLRNWWTESDLIEFKTRTNQLVDQYNKFEPIPGEFINGQLTLGENIGDLGGLTIAHRAYKISLQNRESTKIDEFTYILRSKIIKIFIRILATNY